MMKSRVLFLVMLCFLSKPLPLIAQDTEGNVYLDYPIKAENYDPYFFGRPLGASDNNHSGEDISLAAGVGIASIGTGQIMRYKSDSSWKNRLGPDSNGWCGYGKLYAIIWYRLNRSLRIPVGSHTYTNSVEFSFVFGHILDRPSPKSPDSESTGWEINDQDNRNIPVSSGQAIGYIAPDGSVHCGADDYNGDGEEHLHCGVRPGFVGLVAGYDPDNGYAPAHLVIAASRVGVFKNMDSSIEWKLDGTSQAIFDKWWEYIELSNYHNKLGRPHNNYWNREEGTDFVHFWQNTFTDPPSEGVWIQDFIQPYRGKNIRGKDISYFGTDGQTAIVLNEEMVPPQAFLIREGFWGFYKGHEGYRNLGAPKNEEYEPVDGFIEGFGAVKKRQDFEHGFLAWNGKEGSESKIWAFHSDGSAMPIYIITIIDAPDGADVPIVVTQSSSKITQMQFGTEVWHNGVLLGTTPLTIEGFQGFDYGMTAKRPGQTDVHFEFTVGDENLDVQTPQEPPIILPNTPPDLSLLKYNNARYFFKNEKLHRILNPEDLQYLAQGYSAVAVNLSSKDFDYTGEALPNFPSAPDIVGEGLLVKSPDFPAIYLIQDNKKRGFGDEASYLNRGYKFENDPESPTGSFVLLPQDVIESYDSGADITEAGAAVDIQLSFKLAEGDKKGNFIVGEQWEPVIGVQGDGYVIRPYLQVVTPNNIVKYAHFPPGTGGKFSDEILLDSEKQPLSANLWNVNNENWTLTQKTLTDQDIGNWIWTLWYEDVNRPGEEAGSATAIYTVSQSSGGDPPPTVLVWPGDTNNDGKVSIFDILPLGIYWNATGGARDASSCEWRVHQVAPWVPQAATYADANGSGSVELSDLFCIRENWGRTHTLAAKPVALAQHPTGEVALSLYKSKENSAIAVYARDVSDLVGIALIIQVVPENDLKSIHVHAGELLSEEPLLFSHIEDEKGEVTIAVSQKAGKAMLDGSGIIAYFDLENPPFEAYSLTLSQAIGSDVQGNTFILNVAAEALVVRADTELPQEVTLSQNYPNPFNANTTISYEIPTATKVSLVIYNLLGQPVRQLADGWREAGNYEISWDGTDKQGHDVSSGVYLYRLEAQKLMHIRRMVLLR